MIEQLAEMPTYEAYKDSGLDGLGEIPAHWQPLANKYIFKLKKIQVGRQSHEYEILSLTLNGVIKRDMENPEGKFPAEFDTYQEVCPGNFVFCLFDVEETPRAVGLSSYYGMITGAYTVFELFSRFNRKFIYYFYLNLDSKKMMKPLYKGLRNTIPKERFFEFKTFLPSVTEQTAIAAFLDRKTAQIDQAVVIKEQQIALLKERKQILIQNAVTPGLDSNVTMRNSGVEWIGEIPAHWEVTRLKYIFSETNERTKTGQEVLFSLRMEQGLVPHNDVSDKHIADDNLIDYKIIRPGQMIMNRMRAAIGIFGLADKFGLVSPDYAVFNIGQNAFPEYFLRLFKTPLIGEQFRLNSKGLGTGSSGFMRLYTESFGDIKIPLPPRAEQASIVDHIKTQSAKIDQAIGIQQQQIDKLKEYKATLINSAVTGKIRVPEVEA
jgi:type I restriction enzyme S subunit